MIFNLSCIVEGHGEVSAVPILLRRLQQELAPTLDLRITPLIRVSRKKLVKANELERAVGFAAGQAKPPRAILVLIDADDDCPAELGPQLLARAVQARSDIPIAVVLAKREFEAWFLAALDSLAGKRGLTEEPPELADPEAIRDAKGRLTRLMQGSRAYSPTTDQPALTALFDVHTARSRSDSFDKCWREIQRLLGEASRQPPEMPQHPG